ncbi:MAG: FtsX-like permease family protein [Solirubrobacterales bacterium]|nr:FtsX-like permease family protein [Solirubrobacterales bacterium]
MRRVTVRGLLARKLRLALTALAIVLGVTFVSGTLVLGDTLNRTFDDLIGTAYQHVSFQIRGKAAFGNNNATAVNSTADRKPIPESIAAAVRRVPGVAYAFGSVGGYAQFMARDGSAIGKGGTSTLGFSFDPNPQLSPYRLLQGRAPTAAEDVVMDKATAAKYHFAVGERVLVDLPDRPQTFTISGLVTFGSDNNLAGVTLAGFDPPTAQALFNSRGYYNTISVLAAPGADTVKLQRAIAAILPAGAEVVSGQTVASELSTAVNNGLSFISTALLIFALVSLFVGGFTIFNTFSITVGQRTRELALLRLVGASRRQVFRSVVGEAAVTGLIASLVGLGLGILAALGLKALLKAFGIALPSAPLVFEARTAVVAIAVGVGVTLLSALIPARRAVRIPPVAALVEQSEVETVLVRRRQVIAGIAMVLVGVVAFVAGLTKPDIALVGVGALAILVARGLLLPLVARPLSSALGRPLARLLGTPGQLGRENATRNPRRTAQTATALMIGLSLVSTIAVLGASLSSSAKNSVDSALSADYIVSGKGGFSKSVVADVSRLPGVTTTTVVYQGRFEVRGSLSTLVAASPAELSRTVTLHTTAGTGAPAMAAGELLVDTNTADADHLHIGSTVPVKFAQTGPTTMRIGGIFKANPLLGSYLTGDGFFLSHFDNPLPIAVLLSRAPGDHGLDGALGRALKPYANVSFKTRAQFEASQQASVNQLLGLVYVLLALAILIALIGIVNALMLSVFERTHEIGLLRAVGMKRRQVRAMIRSESVIIALFGAVVGLVIGTLVGVALASSLRNKGVTNVAVPLPSLIGFLVLSALLGLGAATWPARRAANLDVLAAVAGE